MEWQSKSLQPKYVGKMYQRSDPISNKILYYLYYFSIPCDTDRIGLRVYRLCSHMGPCTQEGPVLALMLCCSEILKFLNFHQRTMGFHFAQSPANYVAGPNNSLLVLVKIEKN